MRPVRLAAAVALGVGAGIALGGLTLTLAAAAWYVRQEEQLVAAARRAWAQRGTE